MKKFLTLFILVICIGFSIQKADAQINISSTTPVTEYFSIGTSGTASLPADWKMTPAGTPAPTWSAGTNVTAVTQGASTGAPTAGGRYNWGRGTATDDRSIGFMTSGGYTSPNSIMAFFRNTNASNLTSLNVAFTLERFRINTAAANVRLFYSLDGITWSATQDSTGFTTGASAYGFPRDTVNRVANITGLNIANNGDIYLRWDFNTTGTNSQGLGLDNISITAAFNSNDPTVIINTAAFDGTFEGVAVGSSSASSSYIVSGTDLTDDIVIDPPAGFEIRTGANPFSTSNITLLRSGGTVNATTIDVRFTPTGEGPFSGNITNSSTGATTQNVAVSGNGLSAEPTVQASNVTFASVTASSFTINFNSGNGSNRLVVVKAGSAVDADPVDGIEYTAETIFSTGSQIGTGNYVVYNGTGTSVSVTGLNGATTYHIAVYEFNGTGGSQNYLTTSPAVNNQATLTPTTSVVINKYQNAAVDAVELLVIEDNLDMRGMIIKDFSGNMGVDNGGKFQFTTNSLWASVGKGTIIVLRNNNSGADTVSGGGDYNLDLGLTNASFFTNLGGTFDIATTDMLMIKTAGSGASGVGGSIHALAGGTAGSFYTSAGAPKLIATGTSGTNFFVYANNTNSVLADFNGTDATGGATGLTFGTGNNASNTAFINSLRSTDIEFTTNGSLTAGNYGTITINGSGIVVTATGNVTANTIVLTDGILELGANNLTVNSTVGGSSSTYVRTNGAGRLTINNVGATNVVFPIGNTVYNQLIINNSGTVDNFSVNVQNTIDNPTSDNDQLVQAQWNISEAVAGGSSAILTFRWTAGQQGPDVNHGIFLIGHYTGGGYVPVSCDPVTDLGGGGLGPFTMSSNVPVTSFSPFILGNDGVAPVELASFTSGVNGNNVMLNWSTVNEENNSGFDIERKSVTGEWSKISNVAGSGTSNIAHSYSFEDRNLATGKYNYRLKQIDYNGNFEYFNLAGEVIVGVPTKFTVSQNYPNPFNPSTTINFELPNANFVSLKIYDMMGREVAQLVNEVKQAGYYSVNFNASMLTSGMYFYKVQAGDFSSVKKMMLVK